MSVILSCYLSGFRFARLPMRFDHVVRNLEASKDGLVRWPLTGDVVSYASASCSYLAARRQLAPRRQLVQGGDRLRCPPCGGVPRAVKGRVEHSRPTVPGAQQRLARRPPEPSGVLPVVMLPGVCVFITAVPITYWQSCSRGEEGDSGGHVLRETTHDETNPLHARPPRPTTTTTATRHGYVENITEPSFARANPFITSFTARNPCHEPICTYLNVFVRDVTRFRHLVTSHCIRHTAPQPVGKNKRWQPIRTPTEKMKDFPTHTYTVKMKASQVPFLPNLMVRPGRFEKSTKHRR
jgi:hypothetical protein